MANGAHAPRRPRSWARTSLMVGRPLAVLLVTAIAVRAWTGNGGGRTGQTAPSQSANGPASSPVITLKPNPNLHTPAPTSPPVLSNPANVYAADRAGDFSPAVKGDPERVYVPNTKDGTIDEIDPTTYRVVKVLQVGGVPHHITPSWDLKHLYVDNPGDGLLQGIDPRTGNRTDTIAVPSPYNLYFTPDGTKAIVVAEYHRLIQFRDRRTWRVLKEVSIPWPGVDHMDFSANGRFLLTSCEYSGVVVRVDDVKMQVTGHIVVGGRPVDVKLSPDGKVFYVANQGLGGVSVIDPVHLRQLAFIPTGTGSHGMAVSRNAKYLYVSNRIAGTISVISFKSRRVVATWNVGGSPDMLQVSPNGKQLWATNRFGDTVSVISTTTGKVIHTITVGLNPHGLAFFPQPGRYSVGHNGVYR